MALGQHAYAGILEWLDEQRQSMATAAEVSRRGGGLAFILTEMQAQRGAGIGGVAS